MSCRNQPRRQVIIMNWFLIFICRSLYERKQTELWFLCYRRERERKRARDDSWQRQVQGVVAPAWRVRHSLVANKINT